MELKDHLGNVSTVLTDRKKATPAVDELPRTYDADVLSYADYYPFGMEIAHRTESKEHEIDYQYGYVEVTDFDNPIYNRQPINDEDGGVGDSYTFDHHFGTHATWTVGPNGVYNKYNPLGWGYMLNPSIDPDYISHCYFARGAYPSEPFLIQGSRDPNNNDNDCCNLSYASSSTSVHPHIVVESNSDPAETSLKFTGFAANPIGSLLFFNRVRGMIKLGKNYELGGVNMPSNLRGKGIPEGAYETDISFSIASYDIKPGSLKIYVTDAQGNHYVDPAIISVIENNQTSYNEGDIWHAVNMSVHLLNVDPDLGYRLVIEFDPQNNFSFYPSYVKIKQLKYDIKLFEGYGIKIVNRGTYQTAENTGYRYGFNGQERTDELKGAGNHYTAQFWEYDPRLGKRWNLDPKPNPSISQYATFANNPIWFSDPLGDSINVDELYAKNEDDTYKNELQIKAFEEFAGTSEGEKYIRDRAQEGFCLQGVFNTDLNINVNKNGALHNEGVDVSFTGTLPKGYNPGMWVDEGYTFNEIGKDGRLKITLYGNPDGTNVPEPLAILNRVRNWAHEATYHGTYIESKYMLYRQGRFNLHPVFGNISTAENSNHWMPLRTTTFGEIGFSILLNARENIHIRYGQTGQSLDDLNNMLMYGLQH
jgi:RHS repeat-associated protein